MNPLSRRRLYKRATAAWKDGLIAGGSGKRYHLTLGEDSLDIAFSAGFEAAKSEQKVEREMPVETWALVLAEKQRPVVW